MILKGFIFHVFVRWAISFVELLAFFPIVLITAMLLAPYMNIIMFLLTLSIYSLLGIITGKLSTESSRNWVLIIGFAMPIICAYFIHRPTLMWIPLAVIACALYFRGFKSSEASNASFFPVQLFWVSYLLHFAALFYFQRVHAPHQILNYLTWSTLLVIVLSILIANLQQLKAATLSNSTTFSLPKDILKKNILLAMLTLLFVFFVTYFQSIRTSLIWLWNFTVNLIFTIIAYLNALFHAGQEPSPQQAQRPDLVFPLEEQTRAVNPIWQAIIELFSQALLILLILAIAYLLLSSLFSIVRALIKKLLEFVRSGEQNIEEEESGFTDQRENLVNLKKIKDDYLNRLKSLLDKFFEREKRWDELSGNIEKIRYLYRCAVIACVAAGYPYKKHLTPNELAQDLKISYTKQENYMSELARLYSATRYGGIEADDEKVNELKEKVLNQ